MPSQGRTDDYLRNGRDCADLQRVTDASGVAACTIFPVNQPPGAGVVAANFAGDAFYLPSSASEATIIFAFLTRSFVVGDETAAAIASNSGATVGPVKRAEWWTCPGQLQGFRLGHQYGPPACGDSWTSRPGNSSNPPDAMPPFMGVVVSSTIPSRDRRSQGCARDRCCSNEPRLSPNPGHPGTGTVVAVYCPHASSPQTRRPRPTPHPRPAP